MRRAMRALPNGLEMSRPASSSIVAQTRFGAAGRVGSIELLGGPVYCRGLTWEVSGSVWLRQRWPGSRERRYDPLELGFGEGVQSFGGDVPLRPGCEQYGCRGLDVRSLCDEQEVVAAHSKVPGHHLASCGFDRLAGGLDAGWALLDL